MKKTALIIALVPMIFIFSACGVTEANDGGVSVSLSTLLDEINNSEDETDDATQNDSPDVTENNSETDSEMTPFSKHGKLSVDGTDLVNMNGEKYQLYGMSTHGLAWFPQYVNYEAFKTLRDDWNTNCVRLALYTAEYGGYCVGGDKDALKKLVTDGVDYATRLGMYVIIDWHVLNDSDGERKGDPNIFIDEAKIFFEEMSSLYKDYDNVIYEICNEPNGRDATWEAIKIYAREIIPIIRANDSDAIIIVGTPTWSQDIHHALESPLEYDNIMYALHFYAGTHKEWLRDRVENCYQNGLPIFISEFAICSATGSGRNDVEQGELWMDLIEKYNLSYVAWNLANKAESSSVFAASSTKTSGWTDEDLSEWGKWISEYFKREDNR